MEAKEGLEHRCTIVLPLADNYHVEDVVKLLAFAIRNRSAGQSPQPPELFASRWNAASHRIAAEDVAVTLLGIRGARQDDEESYCGPASEQMAQIWDERTNQLMFALMQRLHKAACNKDLELWSLSTDFVREPPSDPNDIKYWATTSTIFRSDLLKFCENERVKLRFDSEDRDACTDASGSANISRSADVAAVEERILPPVPGKMPKIAIGKLAVTAAWEIEFELGRPAGPSEVMERLRQWVESREGDCLRHSDKIDCVKWETDKGITKIYGLGTCGVTLRTWRASRV